ncbi:MAG: MlaD family protein [bacterium]|nr:MlaD family protein [bacterium]
MEYSKNTILRIGWFFILTVISILIVAFFLGKMKNYKDYYSIYLIFKDVSGLSEESKVYMSGVEIGRVEDLSFQNDYTVKVKIVINKKFKIPKNSIFYIAGNIMSERYLYIEPFINNEYYKDGDIESRNTYPMIDWYQVLKQTYLAFQDLQNTAIYFKQTLQAMDLPNKVNVITNDLRGLIYDTRKDINYLTSILDKNISIISNNINLLLIASKITVDNINSKVNSIGNNLESSTKKMDQILQENKEDVRHIVNNIKQTSENLYDITHDIRSLIRDTTIREDLLDTIKNLRKMSKSLANSAEQVEDLVKDSKLKEDLKVSIAKLRDVVEITDFLLTPAKKLKEETLKKEDFKFASINAYIDSIEDKTDNPAVSIDIDIFPNSKRGFKVGIFDLGKTSKLNLQLTYWNEKMDLRYRMGLINSELGVGIDKKLSDKFYFTAELLKPSDIQLNTFIDYKIFSNGYLRVGYRDILTKDRKLNIGTQFKF